MKLLRLSLITFAVLALTFGTAFAVTRATDRASNTSSPAAATKTTTGPATSASVPVIAPIASGRDPHAAVAQIAALPAAGSVQLSSVVSTAPANPRVATTRAPKLQLADLYAGPPPGFTGPEAAAPAGAGPAYVDPCAGTAPGTGDGSCAHTGTGGTITPVDLAFLWVSVITAPDRLDALDPGWRRCSFPTGGGAPVVVVTSQPVDGARVFERNRASLSARPDFTFPLGATSASERTNFTTNGYDVDHWYRNVQACARINQPSGLAAAVSAHASITAPAAGADSDTQWLFYAVSKPRPQVQLSFDGANTLHVVTPVRSSISEATTVTVLHADGSDGPSSCAEYDTDPSTIAPTLTGQRRRSVGNPLEAVAPSSPLPPPGLATFDVNYDKLLTHTFRLPSSTPWLVCIEWSTQPASFDPTAISEREQWSATTPNRPNITIGFDGVDVSGSASGTIVHAEVRPAGSSLVVLTADANGTQLACTDSVTITDTHSGWHANPNRDPMCNPRGYTDDLPSTVDVVVRSGTHDPSTSRIVLDPSGHNRTDTYSVGTDAGHAVMHVTYGTDSGLPADGSIAPDGGYEARAIGPPTGPLDRPQLDVSETVVGPDRVPRSRVHAGSHVNDLAVELFTDRDVDAHAFVLGYDRTGPARACMRAGGTGDARSHVTARTAATLVIPSLCAGTMYFVSVELRDAGGHTSVYTPWGYGTGTDEWDGYQSTNMYHAKINVHFSYNRARGHQDDIQRAQADVGSLRVDFAQPGRTPADAVFGCLEGIGSNGSRNQLDVDLSENVALLGHMTDVRGRAARGACHLDNPSEVMSDDGEVDMNVEDFLHAGHIDLDVNLTDGPIIAVRADIAGATVVPG